MTTDPYADVKSEVLAILRPVPPGLQSDMDANVRQTLQQVLAARDVPVRAADRARIAQELTDILGD